MIRRILEFIQGLHTPDLMVAQACMMSHCVCAAGRRHPQAHSAPV